MALVHELRRRATSRGESPPDEFLLAQEHVVGRYDQPISIESFTTHGLLLSDENGKSVGFYPGLVSEGMVRIEAVPYSDVLIVIEGSLVLGWVEQHQTSFVEGVIRFNPKSFNPMPKVFKFIQTCPHLSVYGGVWGDDGWECFGCGRLINDFKVGFKK